MSNSLFRLILGATFSVTAVAPSHAALINFDDLVGGASIASPTPVTTRYAAQGVVFSDLSGPMGAVLGTVVAVTGYSPPNVLFATQRLSISPTAPAAICV